MRLEVGDQLIRVRKKRSAQHAREFLAHMSVEGRPVCEKRFAVIALIRHFLGVATTVKSETWGVRKRFVAHFASGSFSAHRQVEPVTEVSLAFERFGEFLAHVGRPAPGRASMRVQIRPLREGFTARLATVRFLARMRASVHVKCRHLPEGIAAHFAQVRFLARVRAVVRAEVGLLRERLAARVAFVRFLAGVGALVRPKVGGSRERLWARLAFVERSWHVTLRSVCGT